MRRRSVPILKEAHAKLCGVRVMCSTDALVYCIVCGHNNTQKNIAKNGKSYKQCVLQFYNSINYPSVVKLAPCFFEDGFHCRTTIELEQNAYLGFIPGVSVPSHFHKHVHTKPLAL